MFQVYRVKGVCIVLYIYIYIYVHDRFCAYVKKQTYLLINSRIHRPYIYIYTYIFFSQEQLDRISGLYTYRLRFVEVCVFSAGFQAKLHG